MLAIDGEQPRFRNWQLDFRFGETAVPSEPATAEPKAPEPPPVPSNAALEPRWSGNLPTL